jgi:hypothetical protein
MHLSIVYKAAAENKVNQLRGVQVLWRAKSSQMLQSYSERA